VGEIITYGTLSMRTTAEGDGEGLRIGWLKKRKPSEEFRLRTVSFSSSPMR